MASPSPVPLSSRGSFALPLRALVALALVGALAGGAAGAVGAATPAHADPLSFQRSGGFPDFGYVKQSSVLTRVITLINDGDDDISIDPTGLGGLTTPFVVGSIDFAGKVIPHGGFASFSVQYTAPPAGTNSNQSIQLSAADVTHPGGVALLPITFTAKSIATDPAHFSIASTLGGSAVDFGSVTVGQTAKTTVTLTNDGVIPLSFNDAGIRVRDTAGAAVPSVTLTSSSFGTAGAVYQPGESAAFELTYAPTVSGGLAGSVRIVGSQATTNPEQTDAIETVALAGAAVDVTIPPTTPPATSSPTPLPPTPVATVVPAQPGAGASTTSLASTGLSVGLPVLVAATVTGIGVIALLLVVAYRRFGRREHR